MPFVKCAVDGCSRKLQPILKVDPRDRDTWFYPECDECGRPACDEHTQDVQGRRVCDVCRQETAEAQVAAPLQTLGTDRLGHGP